jgi:hypothetical protein
MGVAQVVCGEGKAAPQRSPMPTQIASQQTATKSIQSCEEIKIGISISDSASAKWGSLW